MDEMLFKLDQNIWDLADNLLNDPSSFTCDIVAIINSIDSLDDFGIADRFSSARSVDSSSSQSADEGKNSSLSPCPPTVAEVGSTTDVRKRKCPKKKNKKRLTPSSSRLYICDWCDGEASFKSCQGLRFHKTIRCPARHLQSGKHFFKCPHCRKAYVSEKGLHNHIAETHY
ncbi:hypothetical protein HDE_12209 [Halotydeus destructor]|nr:hypothetical protein HDE_12209 [Halotydeus destructor]